MSNTKTYSLISNEPLTDFDQGILSMLNDMAGAGYTPRAGVMVLLTEEGDTVTYHFNNTLQDMMVEKGFMEMEINRDYILENLPFFVEQAEKDGLLGEWEETAEDYYEGDEDG